MTGGTCLWRWRQRVCTPSPASVVHPQREPVRRSELACSTWSLFSYHQGRRANFWKCWLLRWVTFSLPWSCSPYHQPPTVHCKHCTTYCHIQMQSKAPELFWLQYSMKLRHLVKPDGKSSMIDGFFFFFLRKWVCGCFLLILTDNQGVYRSMLKHLEAFLNNLQKHLPPD